MAGPLGCHGRGAVMALLSKSFWVDLIERTVRAFAQGALAGLGLDAVTKPVNQLPIVFALELGGTLALICFLTGLAGMKLGDPMTASFLPAPPNNTPPPMRSWFSRKPD